MRSEFIKRFSLKMKMVKLTGLNAQDIVAKLMLEYTSLIAFKTKRAGQ